MKFLDRRYIVLIFAMSLMVFLASCAAGTQLRVERITAAASDDLYTVIFYDAGFSEKVVILDREDDSYQIEVFSSAYNYTSKQGVPASRALKMGAGFLGSSRYRLSRITDSSGTVYGLELKASYNILRYGAPELMDVDYILNENRIVAKVGVNSMVRRAHYLDKFGGN